MSITRNFFLDANIDGKKTRISTGPNMSSAGMYIQVSQMKDGIKVPAVRVTCVPKENGTLMTCVFDHKGQIVYEYHTQAEKID